jgi:hypothetical protein
MNVPHPTMDCCSKLCFSKSSQKKYEIYRIGSDFLCLWCSFPGGVMCEVWSQLQGPCWSIAELGSETCRVRVEDGAQMGCAELTMSSSMIPMVRIPYWALFFCCYTELNQNACHTTCCGISSNNSNQQSCCRFRAICQMDKGREAILDWTKE